MLGLSTSGAAGSEPAASSAWANSDLWETGFWSSGPPTNTPASTQAKTNNVTRARIGGSSLLSRKNVSTTDLPKSAARLPTDRKLATAGLLGGLCRGGRLSRSRGRGLDPGGYTLGLEVDVGLYLHQQGHLQRDVPRGGLFRLLGRLDGARVLFVDELDATITDVGHRHEPREVTHSQQEVLHFIVGPIELHCNRDNLVVATTGRRGRVSWLYQELGHARGASDLLNLDDERGYLRLRRDSLAKFEELAFDLGGVAPDFLELVYLLLYLVELGLFIVTRRGLFVEVSQKRTQKQEIEDNNENDYSERPEDEQVTVVTAHRRPAPVRFAYRSLAAPRRRSALAISRVRSEPRLPASSSWDPSSSFTSVPFSPTIVTSSEATSKLTALPLAGFSNDLRAALSRSALARYCRLSIRTTKSATFS